jgi:uncharacterized protein (TIGR02594 family)
MADRDEVHPAPAVPTVTKEEPAKSSSATHASAPATATHAQPIQHPGIEDFFAQLMRMFSAAVSHATKPQVKDPLRLPQGKSKVSVGQGVKPSRGVPETDDAGSFDSGGNEMYDAAHRRPYDPADNQDDPLPPLSESMRRVVEAAARGLDLPPRRRYTAKDLPEPQQLLANNDGINPAVSTNSTGEGDSRRNLPHMALARSQLGIKEGPGDDDDNPEVVKYYSSTGLGKAHDSVPWCAAFVGYCLQESGSPGSGGANARSYMQWGKPTSKPQYGDVVVFWRGSKGGWLGHVAFFIRDDGDSVRVLGGNQHDCVCYASMPKEKVLGYRTVSKWSNSKTVAAAAIGFVAALPLVNPSILRFVVPDGIFTAELAQKIADIAATMPGQIGTVLGIISQVLFVYIAYERVKKTFTIGV